MDPITNHSLDFLPLFVLPLMFLTLKGAWQDRQALWDADVTPKDRDTLMRIVMFVLMPIVVFLHEGGHAVATILLGGKVAEFHYGILYGYVVPSGLFTPEQVLIIFLAGNVVEIACGMIALLGALIFRSPPVVALLVYLGLFSISGTVVIYALMSLLGMYGDWIAIYTTPVRSWVPIIATIHGAIVFALAYLIFGKGPRLWFLVRTKPNWARRRAELLAEISTKPSADAYLDLGWLYYEVGLNAQADEAADTALNLSPEFVDPLYLKSWTKVSRGKITEAQAQLTEISHDENASPILRVRSLMSIGQLEEDLIRKKSRGGPVPPESWKLPLEAFTAASQILPDLGDPKFYRARTLNKAGLHTMALDELMELNDCKWLDSKLPEQVHAETRLARRLSGPPQ